MSMSGWRHLQFGPVWQNYVSLKAPWRPSKDGLALVLGTLLSVALLKQGLDLIDPEVLPTSPGLWFHYILSTWARNLLEMCCRTLPWVQHLTHLHSGWKHEPSQWPQAHTTNTVQMDSHNHSTPLFSRSGSCCCARFVHPSSAAPAPHHVPSKPPTHGSPQHTGTWACLARLQRQHGQPCVSVSLSHPPLPGNASDFVMNRPFVSLTPRPALC